MVGWPIDTIRVLYYIVYGLLHTCTHCLLSWPTELWCFCWAQKDLYFFLQYPFPQWPVMDRWNCQTYAIYVLIVFMISQVTWLYAAMGNLAYWVGLLPCCMVCMVCYPTVLHASYHSGYMVYLTAPCPCPVPGPGSPHNIWPCDKLINISTTFHPRSCQCQKPSGCGVTLRYSIAWLSGNCTNHRNNIYGL